MSRPAFALARPLLILLICWGSIVPSGALGEEPAAEPEASKVNEALSLWENFCHHVQIARPDLAVVFGRSLLELDGDDGGLLLAAVETSDYKANRVLDRARKTETVAEVAAELQSLLQKARIDRARDPERIARDIELLALGDRANLMATERLRAAGQYAAPQMLATLQDPKLRRLHPFVIEAMVTIGRPMVYPLAVALPQLEPLQMSQVAQVLARIGYPLPLPYLKQVLETEGVDPDVAQVVEAAYRTLMDRTTLATDLTAAQLFMRLGRSHYDAGTRGDLLPGFDEAPVEGRYIGLIWTYLARPTPVLVPTPVPGPVYADARAMQVAKQALKLDPGLAPALSLYLGAGFRRENRLPEGLTDPSYQEPQPTRFYAVLAGPQRLHDVLTAALDDGDAALALDAIDALASTGGTEALTSTRPSLLRGLTYPDRRVRFRSAEALARTRPDEVFAASHNVVRILADQVRQSDRRYAMVMAEQQEQVNELVASMTELGFEAFGGTRIGELTGQINSRPGVDLIVVAGGADAVRRLYAQSQADYKISQAPILALVSPGDQVRLKTDFRDVPRVFPAVAATGAEELGPAVEAATIPVAGEPIGAEEGLDLAMSALSLLRDIALTGGEVYSVFDAQLALQQALGDDREPVVQEAGVVLAMIDDAEAQQSIFDAALATEGQTQVSLLRSLAESAQRHGNLVTGRQAEALLALVRASDGETALAAAMAHGSLMLSTDRAVSLINAQ